MKQRCLVHRLHEVLVLSYASCYKGDSGVEAKNFVFYLGASRTYGARGATGYHPGEKEVVRDEAHTFDCERSSGYDGGVGSYVRTGFRSGAGSARSLRLGAIR
jgi:hypothetical protein